MASPRCLHSSFFICYGPRELQDPRPCWGHPAAAHWGSPDAAERVGMCCWAPCSSRGAPASSIHEVASTRVAALIHCPTGEANPQGACGHCPMPLSFLRSPSAGGRSPAPRGWGAGPKLSAFLWGAHCQPSPCPPSPQGSTGSPPLSPAASCPPVPVRPLGPVQQQPGAEVWEPTVRKNRCAWPLFPSQQQPRANHGAAGLPYSL